MADAIILDKALRPLLRRHTVAEKLSVSMPTLWRLEQEEGFPQRVRLARNCICYFEDELDEWLEAKRSPIVSEDDWKKGL